MDFEDLPNLRGVPAEGEETSSVEPSPPPGAGISPNPVTELVADLLETTGLIPADRLAAARSRAGTGSIAQALVDEGLATGVGAEATLDEPSGELGRLRVDHSHLPTVDLAAEGVDKAAAGLIPTHVLERAVAIPYRLEGDRLYVAVSDPNNVQAIDELRIATRHTLEISVAPPEDIELELRRIVRATEAVDSGAAEATLERWVAATT